MDNKGEIGTLGSVLLGLVVFAIFVILFWPTFKSMVSVLFSEEDENKSTNVFYERLINEINKMSIGSKNEFLFSTSEDYVLVAFQKDKDSFSGFCDGATYFNVNKPAKCKDKGCICLCDAGVVEYSLCDTKDDICNSFEQNVISPKFSCETFIIGTSTAANLEIKKQKEIIEINALSTKNLN